MYLTRFRVNTARSGSRPLLSSPQAMKAAVMCSFPDMLPGTADVPRILWRLDRKSRADVHLYVVSPTAPDLTHLVEQAGWPTSPQGWQTREYAPFLSRLREGDTWAFRLTANPVHSIRRKEGEPTKRTAHITPRHQIRWLLARQRSAGFEVLEKPQERRILEEGDELQLMVRDRRNLDFRKPTEGRQQNRVTLVAVTFDGFLRVTDPEALRHALTVGIGKGKAYGCGLMTLAPVP